MSARDTLLKTLPSEVHDRAAEVHESVPDPRDVVAELHRAGVIRDGQLREALLALEGTMRIEDVADKPPVAAGPRILGPLGAGAMGEVLLAKDEGLNRVVAVKRLHAKLAGKPAILRRFYKEAQVTARLDHPNIIPIHGLVADSDGGLAYAMKLVQGRTMEDYFDEAREQWNASGGERGDLTLEARLERFLSVCEALGYAHDRGVLHRDLKPENIMIGTFGQVTVMDWGIAKLVDDPNAEEVLPEIEAAPKAGGTRVGTVMGTPRYMSPEQAAGRVDVMDGRSDQYSLGLILFEAVSLRPAVDASLDLEGCLAWAREGRKQKLQHMHRKGVVPRELAAIIEKATQRDPAQRYDTVSELAEDIRRFERDEAVSAKPDTLGQRMHRWIGRHRSLMAFMLMASLMLLGLVGATLVMLGLGAHEYRRWVSSSREAALSDWSAKVGERAQEIDGQVRMAEAQLAGLTYTVENALGGPRADREIDYDPVREAPRGMASSSVYGQSISVERPGFGFPTGVDGDRNRDTIERLSTASHQLARVLLASTGDDVARLKKRDRHDRIANQGTPLVWARVATVEGVLCQMPALGAPRRVPDPRQTDWYKAPRGTSGLTWVGPSIDPDGMGAVVTAVLPAYKGGKDFVGVGAVDLTLAALEDLLDPPLDAEGAWLLDGNGDIVVWRGMNARKQEKVEHKRPPWPDLAKAAAGQAEGWAEADGRIGVWQAIPSLGWTYLVVADDSVVW